MPTQNNSSTEFALNDELTLFYPEQIGLCNISKMSYLQNLANKYGDFYITTSIRKENGQKVFWKWRSVLECWESEKGLWFLKHATHRTCLKCEVFLDMDDLISKERLNDVCDSIEQKYGFPYKAYFSGSKGYHIHILIKEFIQERRDFRQELRKTLLLSSRGGYDMDGLKHSEKSPIAIEGCPHWKTGIVKSLVRCYA